MKRVLAMILCCAGLAAGAELAWTNSYAGGLKAAQEGKRHLLVDFYADTCSWCVKMDKDVYAKEETSALLKDFVCVKVDVMRDPRTTALFQVSSMPRTVVVSPEGRVVADRLGYMPMEEFGQFIRAAIEPFPGMERLTKAPLVDELQNLGEIKSAAAAETNGLAFSPAFLAYLGDPGPLVRTEAARGVREAGRIFLPHLKSALGNGDLGVRIAAWQLWKEMTGTALTFDPWAKASEREKMLRELAAEMDRKAAASAGGGA